VYQLEHDLQWLAVLSRTHSLLQTGRGVQALPRDCPLVTQQVREGGSE
jgi:hypothetical protein